MKPNDIFSKLKLFLSAQELPKQRLQASTETIVPAKCLWRAQNIIEIDACLTRLRITVENVSLVKTDEIQDFGAKGIIIIGHQVQAIFDRSSDKLKSELTLWLNNQ